jgi:hypothetical protein
MIRGILLIMVSPIVAMSQGLSHSSQDLFLKALFSERGNLSAFLDDSAHIVSDRLGVTYDGISTKSLISYDFEPEIKARVRRGELRYTAELIGCEQEYQRLAVTIVQPHISKEFYFHKGRLTSPLFYHTMKWKTIESKYFKFMVSDSSLTNSYAMKILDEFVSRMDTILQFSKADLQTLHQQKILYYLCKDEDEIERLTGYRTRGMYNLAYDAIISTFNTHYHELAHLLINFKVRSSKIYCHPFLLEGFAVAVGGRGGINSDVTLHLGSFLNETQMVSYADLLAKQGFEGMDPSMSYPAAGAYNAFLLETLGSDAYLKLYLHHCGSSDDAAVTTISESELPPPVRWTEYLEKLHHGESIKLQIPSETGRLVYHSDTVSFLHVSDVYVFKIHRSVLIGEGTAEKKYRSKKFEELMPGIPYHGYKYMVSADSQSVSIYNLLTNNLIASYIASFSAAPMMVPVEDGAFCFSVQINTFDEPLEGLMENHPLKSRDAKSR